MFQFQSVNKVKLLLWVIVLSFWTVNCNQINETENMSKSDATEEEYSVEKVLNRRVRNGKVSAIFFLVTISIFCYVVSFIAHLVHLITWNGFAEKKHTHTHSQLAFSQFWQMSEDYTHGIKNIYMLFLDQICFIQNLFIWRSFIANVFWSILGQNIAVLLVHWCSISKQYKFIEMCYICCCYCCQIV